MNTLVYDIKPENIAPHMDIERDVLTKHEGLFTFVIHIHEGCIVDYLLMENANYASYQESFAACGSRAGS